ncbi:Mss4-like protein [Camillea tinctor]|nr:Mss4-like protein [Camillea tinctor]
MSSPNEPLPLVRCQCGAVSFQTPTAKPLTLYHCHCNDCQKQSGSAFGTSAIYPAEGLFPLAPTLTAQLGVYRRGPAEDRAGRSLDCYFCKTCGCRVLHRIVDADGTARDTVSVKAGCVEGLDWGARAKHIFVRSAVMKIPPEWETYETLPPEMMPKK